MKNREKANNNNLNDPTAANDPNVANDPQAQVKVDDLPMSGEQEERVKGGGLRPKFETVYTTKIDW